MAKQRRHPIAVFHFKKYRKIGAFILRVGTIVLDIGNKPFVFVTPSPALSTINTALDKLKKAETFARTRFPGSASARDIKYNAVIRLLNQLISYVQRLADLAVNESTAIAIIEASGLSVKGRGKAIKAENWKREGEVKLMAKSAGSHISYEWQQSSDNINWNTITITLVAKTIVSELKRASKVYFRVRPILRNGPGAWTDSVFIVVR